MAPVTNPSGLTGFDHPIIGVADLDAAAATWQRLGFTLTPMGRHIGWATGNRCIMFADSYVELLGILDPDGYTHGLAERLATRGEGAVGFALTAQDADLTHHAFRQAGIGGEPPKRLERLLDLPAGTVRPAFRLVHPDPAEALGARAFACQHLTPEMIRRPAWLSHPNGATGVSVVTLAVADPPAVAGVYRSLLGDAAVVAAARGTTVRIGATTLVFGTSEDVTGIVGLGIAVKDIAVTRAWLDRNGVAGQQDPADASLTVPPAAASGVTVTFLPG